MLEDKKTIPGIEKLEGAGENMLLSFQNKRERFVKTSRYRSALPRT